MKKRLLFIVSAAALLMAAITGCQNGMLPPSAEEFALTTLSAADVGENTATLPATYAAAHESYISDAGFYYWATGAGASGNMVKVPGNFGAGAISKELSGLEPGTTYQYRAYIEMTDGNEISGAVEEFTTDTAVTATTLDAEVGTGDYEGLMVMYGTVSDFEAFYTARSAGEATYEFYYRKQGEADFKSVPIKGFDGMDVSREFYGGVDISDLTPEATYEYYFQIEYKGMESTGETKTFVAPAAPISVTATTLDAEVGTGDYEGLMVMYGTVSDFEAFFTAFSAGEATYEFYYRKQGEADFTMTPSSGFYNDMVGREFYGRVNISGLTPEAIYEYYFQIEYKGVESTGETKTFVAPAATPISVTATTLDAEVGTGYHGGKMTLYGTVSDFEAFYTAYYAGEATYEFYCRRQGNTDFVMCSSRGFEGINVGREFYWRMDISGLTPEATYEYYFQIEYKGAVSTGETKTFVAPADTPISVTATTLGAEVGTGDYEGEMVMYGTVSDFQAFTTAYFGGEADYRFYYRKQGEADFASIITKGYDSTNVGREFYGNVVISGLTPEATYEYYFQIEYKGVVSTGETKTFVAPAAAPISVTATTLGTEMGTDSYDGHIVMLGTVSDFEAFHTAYSAKEATFKLYYRKQGEADFTIPPSYGFDGSKVGREFHGRVNISGITPGATYEYYLQIEYKGVVSTGETKTFNMSAANINDHLVENVMGLFVNYADKNSVSMGYGGAYNSSIDKAASTFRCGTSQGTQNMAPTTLTIDSISGIIANYPQNTFTVGTTYYYTLTLKVKADSALASRYGVTEVVAKGTFVPISL